MHELFLDTNIVIDYLTNREPFSQSALRLFSLAENNKVRLNVSAISYTTIYMDGCEFPLSDRIFKL